MITKDNWRQHLILNEAANGIKKRSIQNVILVLTYEEKIFGSFSKGGNGTITATGGTWSKRGPLEMEHMDYIALQGWLEYHNFLISLSGLKGVVSLVAENGEVE